jgi:ADYC domain
MQSIISLRSLSPLACLAALSLVACVGEQDAAPLESATEQHFGVEEECPNFACGQNGPSLSGREFHELSELHAPNLEGFTLGTLTKGGVAYELRVSGWEMRATSAWGTLSGAALEGSFFTITNGRRSFRVWIADYSTMQIYAGPLKGTLIPQYVLKWVETSPGAPVAHYVNLCSNPPTGVYREDTLFQNAETTLVFEGNRYDAKRKRVLAGDSTWFNFGCAGNALAKLLLTGHTSITGTASRDQQQTVLKTIVADYCGDGQTFTVGGEPLYWKTSNGYMSFMHTPESLEGRWGPEGAICVDDYRLLTTTNPLAQQYFPDAADGTPGVLAAVAQHCQAKMPPPCNAAPGTYGFDGSLLVSANPAP